MYRRPLAIPLISCMGMALVVAGCGLTDPDAGTTTAPAIGAQTATVGTTATDDDAGSDAVEVALVANGDSGVSGSATLTPDDAGGTRVELVLDGETTTRPANIYPGACGKLDSRVRYPLEDVVAGSSTTTLSATIDDLGIETLAIGVRESSTDATTFVACGELPLAGDSAGLQAVLDELDGSGTSGRATLEPAGQRTKVVIELEGDEGNTRPAHIHEGTCDAPRAEPSFPLTDVIDGRSETVVDASVDELMSTDYIVNVHESPKAVTTYVACGMLEPAA